MITDDVIQKPLMGPVNIIDIVENKGHMKWHLADIIIESLGIKIFKTPITLFSIINPGCTSLYNRSALLFLAYADCWLCLYVAAHINPLD